MKIVERIFHSLRSFLQWISTVLVIGLTGVVFFSVFFRYVLNSPIIWSDEVIMISMLCLTYLGAALVGLKGRHISVDLLEAILGAAHPRVAIIRGLNDIITIIVLSIVAVYGVKLSIYSRDQQTDILLMSYFWVYIILPIGLFFMIVITGKKVFDQWKK